MARTLLSWSFIQIFTLLILNLLVVGCATLPSNDNKKLSYTLVDTQHSFLAKQAEPYRLAHQDLSGLYLLADGMDAFVARVGLIRSAEVSLDLQYYIWKNDLTGRLIISELLSAADRGVRVRLLLDDLDTSGKDLGIHLLNRHHNIEVRLFNAFANRSIKSFDFLTDLSRVNNRMHNKSFTVDNSFTIVGGRNIGNEYFGAQSHSEFSDLDVLAMGSIVPAVSAMFDRYWNSQLTWQIDAFISPDQISAEQEAQVRADFEQQNSLDKNNPYLHAIAQSSQFKLSDEILKKLVWAKADLLADAPDKATAGEIHSQTHITPALLELLNSAASEVLIISPYFVPTDDFVKFLGDLVQRGVSVTIITNSLSSNDVALVHAGYMRYRKALLKQGISLYEFKAILNQQYQNNRSWIGSSNMSLHTKSFIVDRQWLFVGSFNVDPRSVKHNTEMGVLIDSASLSVQLADQIDTHINQFAYQVELVGKPNSGKRLRWKTTNDSQIIYLDHEPETRFWQRFMIQIQSIFVIESLL
ncbi:phospholipase D family protein [Motilimonas sp. E26]|uniref:phospholipase D family protein n=1 Tax=Motilimonas sp. E26 TaxID=2865674 RepID=UPI001E5ABE70|nr:phospholipase D family protein [Motilimonas sp. E26]MCE0556347.1 phospholipase D family protein [Motilimonas sp. E26]